MWRRRRPMTQPFEAIEFALVAQHKGRVIHPTHGQPFVLTLAHIRVTHHGYDQVLEQQRSDDVNEDIYK